MIIYEIEKGDSLYSIATRYGTTVDRIAQVNNINPNDSLIIGQAITIPVESIQYTVMRGDSLYRISRRFGVSLESIIQANPQI